MRVSELSRESGISIPTIKYYLREGLLPPGEQMAPRQGDYSRDHLRRLRLIRALVDVGGLSLKQVGKILWAIDDDRLPVNQLFGIAHHALGPPPDQEEPPADVARARGEVDQFLQRLGWRVSPQAPSRRALAEALVTLRRMGREVDTEVFERYAAIADDLAAWEVATVPAAGSRAEAVEQVVIGTVAFETALVALRRLAQEHHSTRRFTDEA
jgi:DNA-binding transcriptional MerR regulator